MTSLAPDAALPEVAPDGIHTKMLDAGYATSKRTGKGETRASWFATTADGKRALDAHAWAFRERFGNEATPPPTNPLAPLRSAPQASAQGS